MLVAEPVEVLEPELVAADDPERGFNQRFIRRLEDALRWHAGSIVNIMNGGDPVIDGDDTVMKAEQAIKLMEESQRAARDRRNAAVHGVPVAAGDDPSAVEQIIDAARLASTTPNASDPLVRKVVNVRIEPELTQITVGVNDNFECAWATDKNDYNRAGARSVLREFLAVNFGKSSDTM